MWTVMRTDHRKAEMICVRCDNEQFVEEPNRVLEQEFRGELFHVHSPAMVCTKCGWTSVSLGQADALRRATADEYRRRHKLLTSEDIKAARQRLGMTQREFASFLGVGEASVKRWETWLVQDRSNDELIRAKLKEGPKNQERAIWIAFKFSTKETRQGIRVQEEVRFATMPGSRWVVPTGKTVKENEALLGEDQYESACPALALAA